MTAFGRLYGVGVGPGDPDLLTVKATKVIAASATVQAARPRAHAKNADATFAFGLLAPPTRSPIASKGSATAWGRATF